MMKNADLVKEMRDVRGCLSPHKTTTARRRYGQEEDEDLLAPFVDPFVIDSELKIAPSRAVRRMVSKTQVMTGLGNFHVRQRITHCGEVTSAAVFMASILGLNTELTRAIALAHDIGHAPFGHDGEKFLQEASGKNFNHEVFGVTIAQHIERRGKGLNLTKEVLCGIIRDAWPRSSDAVRMSEEAKLVAWADRFAYVTGDFNDIVLRVKYPVPNELSYAMGQLGPNQRAAMNQLIAALCFESAAKGEVSFGDTETAELFMKTKEMLYKIYPLLNASNSSSVLERVYAFVSRVFPGIDATLVVALMADSDVLFLASQPVLDFYHFQQTTVAEMIPFLMGEEIKWWEPDLSW
jgi:putative nucleotidyltransferase with HDIG domain